MKKLLAAIIILDMGMGLLLLCGYGYRLYRTAKREHTEAYTEAAAYKSAAYKDIEYKDTEVKRIALTFDDGPHYAYTEKLLDGLKEREVCATFFVTGEHAALHPEIIERMVREGHLVGNHTYSHLQLTDKNSAAFKEELLKTNDVLLAITGTETSYVRPPYGSWDKSLEKELNMIPILWTVDPKDWCSNDAAGIAGRVVRKAEADDIILMHDYFAASVDAALLVVDELQERGFTFVTVEEILFD